MSINAIRAWKDAEYRNSLSASELALLPQHPAGQVELKDEDLASMVGAAGGFTGQTDNTPKGDVVEETYVVGVNNTIVKCSFNGISYSSDGMDP
jgi:mersacidin/lichenicidin family type 2 lantibiotic